MPFSSLTEIVVFLAIFVGVCFLLKPLQRRLEKILKKFFKDPQREIIDVTPKSNKKESPK